FGKKEEQIFLGREIAQHRDYSEDTAIKIDHEVKRIVEGGYRHATKIMEENRDAMIRLAEALLEHETLAGHEIEAVIKGLPMKPKPTVPESSPSEETQAPARISDDTQLPQMMDPEGKPAPA
ncbi:MAG TPA: cell division protein FtsH, partial [Acidobacteriota bacterium]|nr:cell division protein FtsH [Acidobacteriota bacterium]